jgi:hypothetical protein
MRLALRRGGNSKLNYIRGLLLIYLVIIALVLLDYKELYRKQRILTLSRLNK